jgi:hypothetical protein
LGGLLLGNIRCLHNPQEENFTPGKDMSESDRVDQDAIAKSRPAQRSDVVLESPSDVEAHRRLEDATSALLAIMERLRWEERERPAKAKYYPFPFVVDEDFVRKLNKRATEWLNQAGILSGRTISVLAEVRFQDLSTSRFAALDELLDKAGDRRDPESMTIEWSAVLQEPYASTAKIEAVFTTEKPFQVAELQWFEFPVASMDLEIAGPDRQWVENTFSELDPFFTSVRLGGIYRPLLIFRNRTVVHITLWIIGFVGQMFYFALVEVMNRPQVNATRQGQIERIVSQSTAEAKIDSFVREVYGPVTKSPIFEAFSTVTGSLLTMMIITILGYMLYPKLVPRAGINLGLASTRYASYENALRLAHQRTVDPAVLEEVISTLCLLSHRRYEGRIPELAVCFGLSRRRPDRKTPAVYFGREFLASKKSAVLLKGGTLVLHCLSNGRVVDVVDLDFASSGPVSDRVLGPLDQFSTLNYSYHHAAATAILTRQGEGLVAMGARICFSCDAASWRPYPAMRLSNQLRAELTRVCAGKNKALPRHLARHISAIALTLRDDRLCALLGVLGRDDRTSSP